jgi:hypothetical protein
MVLVGKYFRSTVHWTRDPSEELEYLAGGQDQNDFSVEISVD